MSDVEFFGETFALRHPDDYQWAMCEFAEAATGGVDDNTLQALATVMAMLRACIAEDDWPRFRASYRRNKAQVKRDLMPVVVAAFTQQVPDRPTVRPSDSSDGPQPIERPSESAPASLPSLSLVQRLERQGRADKAEFLVLAGRASA